MADVSHELGALRHLVDSPLSSKVAMFNNQAQQHKEAQTLNPFSGANDGRTSPKPNIPKDQYGKPLAGSLTEARGQKANMHVLKEMLELCQIINSEGYTVKDEPTMRVIPFGELFNIYNYISDKVVGILLRARKHKFVEFEGEMLFQRRDDDVPVFLLRPIMDIRHEIDAKIADIKRGTSPAPQSTSVLMDKSAHQQKLQDAGLAVPGKARGKTKSRTPSPAAPKPKADSPTPAASEAPIEAAVLVATVESVAEAAAAPAVVAPTAHITPEIVIVNENAEIQDNAAVERLNAGTPEPVAETLPADQVQAAAAQPEEIDPVKAETSVEAEPANATVVAEISESKVDDSSAPEQPEAEKNSSEEEEEPPKTCAEEQPEPAISNELPTVVIEATAVYDGTTATTEPTATPLTVEEPAPAPATDDEPAWFE